MNPIETRTTRPSKFFTNSLTVPAPLGTLNRMSQPPEHAVIINFKYGSTDLKPLFQLESSLEKAIAEAGAGQYDGNEVASDGSDGTLYMYGPDAEALFLVVSPVLSTASFMRGASVTLRFGPPQQGTPQRVVQLPS